MERDLILSASLAAALHGAVLFGFNSPPASRSAPREETVTYYVPIPPLPAPEPELPADAETRDSAEPAPRPEFAPPAQPDRPTVSHSKDFVVPTAPELPTLVANSTFVPDTGPRVSTAAGGRGPGGDIVGLGGLDAAPRTRFQPPPVYPAEARHSGLAGEVVVEFIVDESGRVHDARVVRSNHRMFEEPTLRAVSRWVFEPGKSAGRAVRFRMAVPVIFSLND